jgi:hypothetical protein
MALYLTGATVWPPAEGAVPFPELASPRLPRLFSYRFAGWSLTARKRLPADAHIRPTLLPNCAEQRASRALN